VAPVAGLIAHGGVAGAIAESLVGIVVLAIFASVWIRERRARRAGLGRRPAKLRDDEDASV
jgi:hypothetical protein